MDPPSSRSLLIGSSDTAVCPNPGTLLDPRSNEQIPCLGGVTTAALPTRMPSTTDRPGAPLEDVWKKRAGHLVAKTAPGGTLSSRSQRRKSSLLLGCLICFPTSLTIFGYLLGEWSIFFQFCAFMHLYLIFSAGDRASSHMRHIYR